MKHFIAAMMIFFFVATVANAQTAVTTNKSSQTEKTDVKVAKIKCCDHDFVDANHDGFCDKCGMKAPGKTNGKKSGKSGTSANGCSKSCSKSCGGMNNTSGCKPKDETKPSDGK